MDDRAPEPDSHEDEVRILFVGLSESSHTHSWIDLLANSGIHVRLFALPTGVPPDDWDVFTYITAPVANAASENRFLVSQDRSPQYWLAKVIAEWQPHIVHALGLEPAGEFLYDVLARYSLRANVVWVLQLRGGSDLALTQYDESRFPDVVTMLRDADQIITDNWVNIELARRIGVRSDALFIGGPVPGTGGVDVDVLRRRWHGMPSERRIILWPKAYTVTWSAALPVLEAFRLIWREIQPCEVHMLAMSGDTLAWFRTLPPEFRAVCRVSDRLPRNQLLELMARSRVMLAPSLIDGTPNSLFEAMACGAVPVVSPLETITPIVSHAENVLFARNLYPTEIADALVQAMNDDPLVDRIARNNLGRVRDLADRETMRDRLIQFYRELRDGTRSNTGVSHLNIDRDLGPSDSYSVGDTWPVKYASLLTEYSNVTRDLGLLRSEHSRALADLAETRHALDALKAASPESSQNMAPNKRAFWRRLRFVFLRTPWKLDVPVVLGIRRRK